MDESKTKEYLLAEIHSLRQRIADLEAQQSDHHSINTIRKDQFSVLDTVEQAVIATDLDGHIIYWNPFAEKLYGWTAAEAQGRNIVDVTPSAMTRNQAVGLMQLLRTGERWSGEFDVQRRDGSTFPAFVVNSPIYDMQRRVVGVLGFSIDLTPRKALEAQLREETETIEMINRTGQLLSAELDLQKLVQSVTDAATELSGAAFGAFFYNVIDQRGESYTLYTLSGAPYEAFSRFPMPRNTQIFGPTFRGEAVIRLDDVHNDPRYGKNAPYSGMPAGHLPVRSYLAVPVISRSGTILGGLFFGHPEPGVFTERAERIVVGLAAQAAIAMDNAQLYQEAQQAVRARDEFLSLAAHELKTPITTILGYVQLLLRRAQHEGRSSERDERALQILVDQANRLNQLIGSLFDLSRLQIGQLSIERSLLDLRALVQRIVGEIQPTLDQHAIVFNLDAADQPLRVQGDAIRLEQVIQNLLRNAIKYSPNGGTIEVELGLSSQDSQAAPEVLLAITDQGIGIPAEALSLIFRRFYRAKNVEQTHISGIGVGLYVAREIITLHGGTIDVESTEGVGSTFRIRLPLDQPSDSTNETPSVTASADQ